MSKTYLITLTPTGKFFFGGDMTFNSPGQKSEFVSYIIHSTKFPQQTSLLGMLRFLILSNDKNSFDAERQQISNREVATELIGPKSFENTGEEGTFGKIKKLYPCFLQKDGKDIVLLPKDKKHAVTFGTSTASINGISVSIPDIIEGYDPKEGITSLYEVEGIEVEEGDIFIEDICNGINRDIKTGKVEDDSLFKQISYRLNDKLYSYDTPQYNKNRGKRVNEKGEYIYTKCQYNFAFYAEVDIDDLKKYDGQTVSVGGDSSQFIIGIKQTSLPTNQGKHDGTRIVLTSPSYIPNLKGVRFAITDTIPFKCMSTQTANIKSYNKRNQLYDYSEKLMLYTAGSVFFVDKENKQSFIDEIENQKDFRQIGYNYYKEI